MSFTNGTNTGLKYGLTIRKKPPQHSQSTPSVSNIFAGGGDDDDDGDGDREGDDNDSGGHSYTQRRMSQREMEMRRKALEENPSIFEYDSVYDSQVQHPREDASLKRQQRHKRPLHEQKSLYVEALKKKAVQRKREEEMRKERVLARAAEEERKKMGEDAGPVYVTTAYKKKLKEMEQQREQEKLVMEKEEREQRKMVKRGMGSFYANLLGRNETLGGGRSGVRGGVDEETTANDRAVVEKEHGMVVNRGQSRWDNREGRREDDDHGRQRQRSPSRRSHQESRASREYRRDAKHDRYDDRYDDRDEYHHRDRDRYGSGDRRKRSYRDDDGEELDDRRQLSVDREPKAQKTEKDASIERSRQRALQRLAERRQKNATT